MKVLQGGVHGGLGDLQLSGEFGFQEALAGDQGAVKDHREDRATDLLDFGDGENRLHGDQDSACPILMNDNRRRKCRIPKCQGKIEMSPRWQSRNVPFRRLG